MEQRRYLRCLGQPALFAPTGELIRFRTKKHLALLIYIAVEDRSHRRDRLAELLWPKVSQSEARHSLATALSTLRPRLGPDGLESSRDHVHLASNRVSLDLERLEAGDVLGSEITGPLEVAAFLEGFDIPDSAEFTHWKDRQHARLIPMIKDALVVLIDRCRRTGDSRKIERLADRMLALDDLSEEAIRAKMEARAFAGDRLTALEIFEEWKAKLADELQAAPSDLVEGMAVRLRRRGWERTTLPNIPNVPTDQWRGRPFIGRTTEYRVLYEAWEDVRRGCARHALLLGDSGVGKSTLVQRLTTAAGLEGAAISRVQCYDLEREIPFSTVSNLVIGLLDRPGVSATSPDALAEIARTVPEVRHRFPHIPPSIESEGESARIRLTEAFLELLIAIAEEHPVVLVVDDLHFADDVSLAVLHLIIRRASARAIMVVLVARPGELLQSTQAVRLQKSNPSLGILEIEVPPLSNDESREVLHSLIDPSESQPNVAEQRALLRAAAGYPMVLELLVQDWKASGAQSLALSVNAMTAEFGAEGPAQAAYHQILARITLSLDGTAQSVLNLASILGRRLNDLGMYGIVDLSAGQTMVGMAELVNRRVLRDGAQGLEFVNELIRAAAYIGVPQTLRRALHGNIADRFIDKHNRGESDLGLEIAWHCIRAGRGGEATPHLLSGAREAMRRGALESAERGLATALPHLDGSERADAVMILADILQEQGRWLESLALLDSQARDDDNVNQDWKTVLTINARFHLYPLTVTETIDQILALVKVIRESDRTAPRIAAALAATTLGGNTRDKSHAQVVLDSLPFIPVRHLCQEDLSRLSLARARLMFQLHDCPSSLHEIETALAVLDSSKAVTTTAAQFHFGLGTMSGGDGDYKKALGHLEKAYAVAERLGNDTLRSAIAVNLSLVHCRMGSYDMQLQWARESLSLGGAYSNNYHGVLAAYCGALASISKGAHAQAREFIFAANSRVAAGLPEWALQAWDLYRADLHRLLGNEEESRVAALAATRGSNARLHSPSFAGAYCRWTASLASDTEALRSASYKVHGFVVQLSSYDALDRAEILASFLFLQRKLGQLTNQLESLLFDHLKTLPPAVTDHLTRLRILE